MNSYFLLFLAAFIFWKMPKKARRWVAAFFLFVIFAMGGVGVLMSYGYGDFAMLWVLSMVPVMGYLIWRIHKSEKEAASENAS